VPLLLLAATLALSYIYPQVSAYVRSDPMTYEEWLSTVQVHYRRWTPFLRTLGLFHVRDTPWFRVLLALLALVLLVSLADQVDRLAEERHVQHTESFYEHDSLELSSDLAPSEAVARIREAWMGLGIRARDGDEPGIVHLHAQQRAWAGADIVLTYLGALFLVAALAVNARWGWRQLGVQVYPDRPIYLGPEASHRLTLVEASADSSSATILVDGRGPLPISSDRSNGGMAYNYELTEQGGPLVNVSAQASSGDSLSVSEYALRPERQSTLSLAFSAFGSEDQTVRLFILPEEKVVVRLEWLNPEEAGTEPPRFRQWVFEQGGQTLVGTSEVAVSGGSATTEIGGVTYLWQVSSYAVLNVAYQPGLSVLSAGAVLALLGLGVQLVPRQQAWARVRGDENGTTIQYRDQSAPRDVSLRRAVVLALDAQADGTPW
jgi:hypothetical protein